MNHQDEAKNLMALVQNMTVEWKPLGEVADYEQPTKYLVASKNYDDKFDTPVLTAGKTFILGYTDETEGIYKASGSPVIIFDDFTTANKWVDFDFKVKSSAMKMITSKNEQDVLLKYVYYWLNTLPNSLTDGDHKRQWISNFSNKEIPIPPLEIQQKIVKILDKFTELEATLEATLEAELHLRKRQYNYYRDYLLTFNESGNQSSVGILSGLSKNIIQKKLEEIVLHLRTGLNPRANFKLNTIDAENFYVTVRELSGNNINITEKTDKINDNALEIINNRSQLKIGDILFSGTGTIGKTAIISEEPKNWNIKEGVYALTVNSKIIIPMFLLRLLQSSRIMEQLNNLAMGSTVRSISMADLKKIDIPIPPLAEQARIVAILDKFDTLASSLSEGLPCEIALHRQQYEYYREQLLAFPHGSLKLG